MRGGKSIDSSDSKIVNILLNNKLQRIILIVIVCIILTFVIGSANRQQTFHLQIGSISPMLIKAPMQMENTYQTEKARKAAIEKVAPLYQELSSVTEEAKKNLQEFYNKTQNIRKNNQLQYDEKIEEIRKESRGVLSKEEGILLLNASLEEFVLLRNVSFEILNMIMNSGIKQEGLDKALIDIKYEFDKKQFSTEYKRLSTKLISSLIQPNIILDELATEQAQKEAEEEVSPIMIQSGQKIVGESEVITEEIYHILEDAGFLKERSSISWKYYLNLFFIILILYTFIELYFHYFRNDLFVNMKYRLLIAVLILLIIFIGRGMVKYSYEYIPVTIVAMIIASLIDTPLAILVNSILILFLSMMYKESSPFVYAHFMLGTLASFLFHNTYERKRVFWNGIIISVGYGLLVLSYSFFIGRTMNAEVLKGSFFALVNGGISVMLAIGSLPFLENIFNIVTPNKLLDLMNTNHPLLRKMLMEAPGTYNHSLMVANLAENAVHAIGGNELLTRVGAYYHDIGKLHKPYYYTENQYGQNPHDEVDPGASAYIIMNHIKYGLEEAKKYKLPQSVIEFIETHHGTTLVKFFYYKAKEMHENIKEEEFRYKGPKPRTRETAVVMLADTVEAAVRSIPAQDKTSDKIEALVRRLIQDKMDDGQLNESSLRFMDIEIIIKSFMKVFNGMYHQRIPYPEKRVEKKEEGLL